MTREGGDLGRFSESIKRLSEGCFVPLSAGGKIRNVGDATTLLRSGADKIVLNTAFASNPALVRELADYFGRQCIVASIDVKRNCGSVSVWTMQGAELQSTTLDMWLEYVLEQGAGEIYLNSIDRDGTGQGYDLDLLNAVTNKIEVPIILAGGAGKPFHLIEGLSCPSVNAVATAHLFNFVGNGLALAREKVMDAGIEIADWNPSSVKDMCGALQ